jgi:hypothetical protein
LRDVIHLMQIVKEVGLLGWKTFEGLPTLDCKLFEDNSGALEIWLSCPRCDRELNICASDFTSLP